MSSCSPRGVCPLVADALRTARFSGQEITTMIVSNSRPLAGPRPAGAAS
jgi:hypothetical protein